MYVVSYALSTLLKEMLFLKYNSGVLYYRNASVKPEVSGYQKSDL
jgi:hypothetical protein